MTTWDQASSVLVDRCFHAIDAQPEILLETEGATVPKADIYYARLIGFDEQIDAEWRVREPGLVLLRPLAQVPSMVHRTDAAPLPLTLMAAEYHLLSNFATLVVHALSVLPPPDVKPDNTGSYTLACLRYRRVR